MQAAQPLTGCRVLGLHFLQARPATKASSNVFGPVGGGSGALAFAVAVGLCLASAFGEALALAFAFAFNSGIRNLSMNSLSRLRTWLTFTEGVGSSLLNSRIN